MKTSVEKLYRKEMCNNSTASGVINYVITSLEASAQLFHRLLRTYFGCAVDVLDGEGRSQTVQQNFSQRRDELRRGHQHVHAVAPAERRQQQTLVYEAQHAG